MFTFPDGVAREHDAIMRTNPSVLLVDDHEGTRKSLRLVLRSFDCNVDIAANGHEALELLRRRKYDLVLMDLMMPVMDGLEATRQFRQESPRGMGPRIVGITADPAAETRDLCLAIGMDDFLTKPLDIQELMRVIDEVATRRVPDEARIDLDTRIIDATPMAAMPADVKPIENGVASRC